MGYSHYWVIEDPGDMEKAMTKLINDCRKIIEQASIDSECNLDTPDFKDRIELNGLGDDGREPFQFTYHDSEGQCKTDRKPYDVVVCAILLRAKHLAPNAINIRSDGDWDDWSEAAAMVSALWPNMIVTCPWDKPGESQSGAGHANVSQSQTPYSGYTGKQVTTTIMEQVRNLYPEIDDAGIEKMIKFIETVKEKLRNSYSEKDDAEIEEMIKQNISREQVTGPVIWLNIRQIASPCSVAEVLDMLKTKAG
ncbi:hypothetical protein F5883DRAFT_592977 [Diaporthe sp. PMI_573]|nr:hypothetical protein F5883DRAFT_592977 [Diaporthaceae sp. PMI_573]